MFEWLFKKRQKGANFNSVDKGVDLCVCNLELILSDFGAVLSRYLLSSIKFGIIDFGREKKV